MRISDWSSDVCSSDLPADAVRARYGFDAPGAILSRLAAVVDPYRMAYRLFARLEEHGAGVFERTRVDHVEVRSAARRVGKEGLRKCRSRLQLAVKKNISQCV